MLPTVPNRLAVPALLVVVGAGLVWVRLAFASVPLRMRVLGCPSELHPATERALRDAATAPLVLLVLGVVAASVLAVRWAIRRQPESVRWTVVTMAASAAGGGFFVAGAYAVGDFFAVMAAGILAGIALLVVYTVLAFGWSRSAQGRVMLLLAVVATLQMLVLPGAVALLTLTGEMVLC